MKIPIRPQARPTLTRPSAMSRAFNNYLMTLPARACSRFTPLGVMLNEQDRHASRCIRCETCDGFPCLVSAKSDAQVCAVDPALKYANVTLKTNAYVERLETNPSGREISKVIIRNNGTREEVSGDIVVSSCGAINSGFAAPPANDKHPKGLANSSTSLGAYMGHVNSY